MTPLIAVLLGVVAVVAIYFWPEILNFVRTSIIPFIRKISPGLAQFVEDAFVMIDNVVSPLTRMVKKAWNKIRGVLLKSVVSINQKTSSKWVKTATSWLIDKLEDKTVKKVTTTETISWENLPPDVREEILRNGDMEDKNVTKIRDRELAKIEAY